MPVKKTTAQKQEKSRAKKVAKGKRYVKTATKLAGKAEAKKYSPKRRVQTRGLAQGQTAENLGAAGTAIQKSKGQGKLEKRRKLKVTPRSMHKAKKEEVKNYTGKKRARKARGK